MIEKALIVRKVVVRNGGEVVAGVDGVWQERASGNDTLVWKDIHAERLRIQRISRISASTSSNSDKHLRVSYELWSASVELSTRRRSGSFSDKRRSDRKVRTERSTRIQGPVYEISLESPSNWVTLSPRASITSISWGLSSLCCVWQYNC